MLLNKSVVSPTTHSGYTQNSEHLTELIGAIPALDQIAIERAKTHIAGLLKPIGSLGRLESLAVQLCGIRGDRPLEFARKTIFVMVADHGVYAEGIAISPQIITQIQAQNMLQGNTGVCVLAANSGCQVKVIDAGMLGEPIAGIESIKLACGSGNIAQGPAMTRDQAIDLLLRSAQCVMRSAEEGNDLVGVGELGMGNTTPAAALISVFSGESPQQVVGLGANFPVERIQHKIDVVTQAITHNNPDANDPLDVLAKVGGFDLVAMAGAMLGAAASRQPVILDGFLSYAAALAACRLAPALQPYLIPSHLSAEKGAQIALRALGLRPYLDMELRLGEGSGAALAMPLIDAACAMYNQMGSLAESNIVLPAN